MILKEKLTSGLFRSYLSVRHPNKSLRCEHYSRTSNKDHFHDDYVGESTGAYDLDYIEAVLCEDEEEITRIEETAFSLGYGPLVPCRTLTNASSQKAFCRSFTPFIALLSTDFNLAVDHRDENGCLIQPIMTRLECEVKFRVFQPLEEYRQDCPFVLITSAGAHTHPIPLPTKTPPAIRSQIFQLFDNMAEDLPDLTPRRFQRHPIVKTFLAGKFPMLINPSLSDLHVSLANRSHLKAYIKQAKEFHCPFGTDWQGSLPNLPTFMSFLNRNLGVLHLKALQDANLDRSDHYIRRIIAIDLDSVVRHEEDDWEDSNNVKDTKLRIIVCMYPEASSRLLNMGQYLQSDIAFKRIVGYLEFEIACMDRDANSSAYIFLFLGGMS